MFDCTQLLVLSKQSFAIDHKVYRGSPYFSPALSQQIAVRRGCVDLSVSFGFKNKSH